MILVIGTVNCSRCNMVKNILDNKKIEYEYKLIDDMSELDQNTYLSKANGQMSYPIIFNNDQLTTLQNL